MFTPTLTAHPKKPRGLTCYVADSPHALCGDGICRRRFGYGGALNMKITPANYLFYLLIMVCASSLFNGYADAPKGDKLTTADKSTTSEFAKVPKNTAGSAVLRYGNPWKYWGRYPKERKPLCPHKWHNEDSVVDGWDWSLPPTVKPSANARIRFGMHGWKNGKLLKMNIPEGVTVVDELWWSWNRCCNASAELGQEPRCQTQWFDEIDRCRGRLRRSTDRRDSRNQRQARRYR